MHVKKEKFHVRREENASKMSGEWSPNEVG